MDYLTVKELAELKGCSERYIKQIAKSGKLNAEIQFDAEIKQERYMIPVQTLPDDLKARYYKQKRTEAGLLPEQQDVKEKKAEKPQAPQRSFEELSADERAEVNLWTDIVREWQGMRSAYKGSKTEFDKLYVGKCQLEHPEIKVSADILYRKWNAYKNNEVEGLIDKRGAWNKGKCRIPAPVWDYFLYSWLDENQPTASLCYRNTIEWAEEFYPELVCEIPTERSFRRQIDRDVAYAIKTLMREGEKAFNDRCAPYIMRMYENLEANDCWIADNHTFDIISFDGKTKHRLYLTAFSDAKSGVMVGWNITDSPCAQSTILALRHGIMRFGIPKCIYVDNGREFLNISFGGRGNRSHKSMEDQPEPPAILNRLGIEMRNAIVRNAKAKPIERTFRTVKEQFSKLFEGFCGGTILERPESLKFRIKNGKIPRDYEIRDIFDSWIDGEYNCQNYGGSERCFKGMSRIDVWNKTIKEVRQANPNDLNLMLMSTTRAQKIKRNGVYVTICGEKYWYMNPEETIMNLQHEVFVRYDPADLRSVRLYDAVTDKFMFEWKLADVLILNYLESIQENVADAQERIRMTKKFVHEQAAGITANLSNEQRITMIEMTVNKTKKNKAYKFVIQMPKRIISVMAGEEYINDKQAVGAEETPVEINLRAIAQSAAERKGK
ncbi:MAG: Mu transposase C-terminal domain-containing protein [Alistipes sp.]|nr:Mu transposase C-terminal domain-containing protein [Alistipes sp.]